MFPGILKRIGRFFAMAVGVSLVGAAIGWNLLVAEPPLKPGDAVQYNNSSIGKRYVSRLGVQRR